MSVVRCPHVVKIATFSYQGQCENTFSMYVLQIAPQDKAKILKLAYIRMKIGKIVQTVGIKSDMTVYSIYPLFRLSCRSRRGHGKITVSPLHFIGKL